MRVLIGELNSTRPYVMLSTSRTQIIKINTCYFTACNMFARGPGTYAAPLLAIVIAALSPSQHLTGSLETFTSAQNSEVFKSKHHSLGLTVPTLHINLKRARLSINHAILTIVLQPGLQT